MRCTWGQRPKTAEIARWGSIERQTALEPNKRMITTGGYTKPSRTETQTQTVLKEKTKSGKREKKIKRGGGTKKSHRQGCKLLVVVHPSIPVPGFAGQPPNRSARYQVAQQPQGGHRAKGLLALSR